MPRQSVQEKKAALQAELAKLEAIEQEEKLHRLSILGDVVETAMIQDEDFKTRMTALLDANVKKNADRELFGLSKLASNRGRPPRTSFTSHNE